MGRIGKGVKCSIIPCDRDAVRSIPAKDIESAGLKIEAEKRAYLCENHYKEFKKKSKSTRQIEKWRWNA